MKVAGFILSASLAGCGTPIGGDLPQVATPASGLLSPEEVKARTEALIRAKEDRGGSDQGATSAQRS